MLHVETSDGQTVPWREFKSNASLQKRPFKFIVKNWPFTQPKLTTYRSTLTLNDSTTHTASNTSTIAELRREFRQFIKEISWLFGVLVSSLAIGALAMALTWRHKYCLVIGLLSTISMFFIEVLLLIIRSE